MDGGRVRDGQWEGEGWMVRSVRDGWWEGEGWMVGG